MPYIVDGDARQRLDLYQPQIGCEAVPLVVWVHGGGWQGGDKSNGVGAKVDLWTTAGWAVASVNYRLTDPANPVDERIVAPAHDEDVAAAVAWLVMSATDLGVDPDRIVLAGHSAGAAIVAAVVADPTYLRSHQLEPTAIACAAPLDTEGFDVSATIERGGEQSQLYRLVFGDVPARWVDLSPIAHLGEAAVPDLFLVTRGTPERRAQVAAFSAATSEAGGKVTVVDLPGFTHADVNGRIGAASDDVLTPALQDFLTGCLTPRASVDSTSIRRRFDTEAPARPPPSGAASLGHHRRRSVAGSRSLVTPDTTVARRAAT